MIHCRRFEAHCNFLAPLRADATVGNGFLDVRGRAAVQPVIVGQVREALGAAGVRAMAAGARVHEQALADRHGLRVVRQGRVVWLRQAGKWLVPWSTQDLPLPPALACFFSPRTNELTVITTDNHAVCVPVPNG